MERVFVIQQIGEKDSPERKRADEIYTFIIMPVVKQVGLESYRADLDLTPGAITPKMLGELLGARVVIADLTGHNPNVFYELGITHSFARPLVSIADAAGSLPFDAKDERIIELGCYPAEGLGFAQGQRAKVALLESLQVVLADDYVPTSPLREVAARRRVDQLAPENPVAAEITQLREAIEDIRKIVTAREDRIIVTRAAKDVGALRVVVARHLEVLDGSDFDILATEGTSTDQDSWVADLRHSWQNRGKPRARGERNSDDSGPATKLPRRLDPGYRRHRNSDDSGPATKLPRRLDPGYRRHTASRGRGGPKMRCCDQVSGLRQRRPGKRAKSVSFEHISASYSNANAAS